MSDAVSRPTRDLAHPALAHHFDSIDEQREASTLGMWVFLVTEIMFFGGLFLAYLLYRVWYPEGFAEASRDLDLRLGALNTAILIASSLTMALAVHGAQLGSRQTTTRFLLLTILLGAAFLVIKAFEYGHKFEVGHVPGPHFHYEGAHAQQAEIFFSLYFAMTGLHALHMVIGIGVLTVLTVLAYRGRFTGGYHHPVETTGLYWHFVDIVWIYLFPLLYLINRHR